MCRFVPRSLTAGLLGGSLAATGVTVADAGAPAVEPAVGPPSIGDRPMVAPATVGTYESCSALFPALDKNDLAVIEIDVEAGDGVVPDPLPGVPDEIVPVVRIDNGIDTPVECVPAATWTDQQTMWSFLDPGGFLTDAGSFTDPDKYLALPGTNYFTIPVLGARVAPSQVGPSIVQPTVTLRFEHSLADGLVVSSDPEDITDAWVPIGALAEQFFNDPANGPTFLARITDGGFPDEADDIERLELSSDCDNTNPDNQFTTEEIEAMNIALRTVFGLPVNEDDEDCFLLQIAIVGSLVGFTLSEVVDGLAVVTVTIDGPAPTTTTTLPAETTTTSVPIDTGVLPPTGSQANLSAMIAGLLVVFGLSGLMASRRRRADV